MAGLRIVPAVTIPFERVQKTMSGDEGMILLIPDRGGGVCLVPVVRCDAGQDSRGSQRRPVDLYAQSDHLPVHALSGIGLVVRRRRSRKCDLPDVLHDRGGGVGGVLCSVAGFPRHQPARRRDRASESGGGLRNRRGACGHHVLLRRGQRRQWARMVGRGVQCGLVHAGLLRSLGGGRVSDGSQRIGHRRAIRWRGPSAGRFPGRDGHDPRASRRGRLGVAAGHRPGLRGRCVAGSAVGGGGGHHRAVVALRCEPASEDSLGGSFVAAVYLAVSCLYVFVWQGQP